MTISTTALYIMAAAAITTQGTQKKEDNQSRVEYGVNVNGG